MNHSPQHRAPKKIASHFESEEAAREYLEGLRWPNGPICPHCGTATKPYALKKGRYRCADPDCRMDFTVRVGTVFESSHIPLHKWLLAAFLLCSSKKGISSHQLHRMMRVTYKTAWFMTHRIREAMREGTLVPLGGPGKIVEMDETYVGRNPYRKMTAGPGHKLAVISLVERGGSARSFYVQDVSKQVVEEIVRKNVHRETEMMTDDSVLYKKLDKIVARHDSVKHGFGEYIRRESDRVIGTNVIEGYFSIFKRGMIGVYQHCKEKHLHRYTAEFDFRYSERSVTDTERTEQALRGIVGKRLTYRRTRQQPGT